MQEPSEIMNQLNSSLLERLREINKRPHKNELFQSLKLKKSNDEDLNNIFYDKMMKLYADIIIKVAKGNQLIMESFRDFPTRHNAVISHIEDKYETGKLKFPKDNNEFYSIIKEFEEKRGDVIDDVKENRGDVEENSLNSTSSKIGDILRMVFEKESSVPKQVFEHWVQETSIKIIKDFKAMQKIKPKLTKKMIMPQYSAEKPTTNTRRSQSRKETSARPKPQSRRRMVH